MIFLEMKLLLWLMRIKSPGNYAATFDASSLASGVYIYTLRSNNFVQTKKMILMK